MRLIRKYRQVKKLKKLKSRFATSSVSLNTIYDSKTELEGDNLIYPNVNICGSKIGYATYINSTSVLENCLIGKYCSIGSNVKVVSTSHPISFCSTYPGFYDCHSAIPFGTSNKHFDDSYRTNNGYNCEIGNDVWIGYGVLIKGGVKIADGAVVGMGSVVTKDVPPYAIVAGNPAKIIRYRFEDKIIKKLLELQWWDWDPSYVKKNKILFSDVNCILGLKE